MEKIFEDYLDNVQIDDEELQDDNIDNNSQIVYDYRLEFDVILRKYFNKDTIDALTKDLLQVQRRLTMMLNRCPQITAFSKPVFYDENAYSYIIQKKDDMTKRYNIDGIDFVGVSGKDIYESATSTTLYGIVTFNSDFNNAYNVLNFLKYFIYRIFTISTTNAEIGTSSTSNVLVGKSSSWTADTRADNDVEFYSVDYVDGVPQIIWPTISRKILRLCHLLISPDYTFGQAMKDTHQWNIDTIIAFSFLGYDDESENNDIMYDLNNKEKIIKVCDFERIGPVKDKNHWAARNGTPCAQVLTYYSVNGYKDASTLEPWDPTAGERSQKIRDFLENTPGEAYIINHEDDNGTTYTSVHLFFHGTITDSKGKEFILALESEGHEQGNYVISRPATLSCVLPSLERAEEIYFEHERDEYDDREREEEYDDENEEDEDFDEEFDEEDEM